MELHDKLYIGGTWVDPVGTGWHDVVDSNTEEIMGRVPDGSPDDVGRAVEAAAKALPGWAATPLEDRTKLVNRIGEGLAARIDDLGPTIAKEVGMPIGMAGPVQVGMPATALVDTSNLATSLRWEEELGNSLIVREPIGVVGAITPWNYPLFQVALKMVCMTLGCTFVLKPSELAPLSAFALAEVVDEVGLPPGVFNLVTGSGPVVGEAIAAHPQVDMVSFTGSTRAGRRVMQLAAETIKKVSLELGGKSANVFLEGTDLDKAVPAGLLGCYINSGQTCTALTRMIVPRSQLADIEERAVASVAAFPVGPSTSADSMLGPLVSETQMMRVRSYIQKGIDEGAKLITGGVDRPEGLEKGYFVQPTIFSQVTPDMTIAQEEIFGPVLSIIPYDTEEEAIRIANGTTYGLAGAVWAGDKAHAEEVARMMQAGTVDVNGAMYNMNAPFGGYKQSGIGKERGLMGLEEFLTVKAIQL